MHFESQIQALGEPAYGLELLQVYWLKEVIAAEAKREKKLKFLLQLGVVMDILNPSTQEAEVGASLSLRPAWSTK